METSILLKRGLLLSATFRFFLYFLIENKEYNNEIQQEIYGINLADLASKPDQQLCYIHGIQFTVLDVISKQIYSSPEAFNDLCK